MAKVAAIILAAGESRRMGFPKPLLKIDSTTFIGQTLERVMATVPSAIVVLGAHEERVRAAVPSDPRIKLAVNKNYLQGQLSSLRVGLRALGGDEDGALVHLADHPLVTRETFAAVIGRYERGGAQIVIARRRDRRGHPVLFDRSLFGELQGTDDARGARAVVDADASRVAYVDVEDPGVVLDLDTPQDLAHAGLEAPPSDKPPA